MPTRAEYNHSFESPSQWLRVRDPDLLEGHVQRVPYKTSAGTTTVPWAVEGEGSLVYKFRCQSNRMCALKVFTQPFDPTLITRYASISPYLETVASDLTVRCKAHDPGIAVALPGGQEEELPLVEMDWVEGESLLDKVDNLCQENDQPGLSNLLSEWIGLFQTLQVNRIAHGDLSGTNVMVRPNGRLCLVDYDGMYIPLFAGQTGVVVGSENYQHPTYERPFGERMDLFSALVIYTALLALEISPQLWKRFAPIQQDRLVADCLLFTRADLQNPVRSPLFQALDKLGDSRLDEAVRCLRAACRTPNVVPLPAALVERDYVEKLALSRLEEALRLGDDEAVRAAWVPALHGYLPAQKHLASVLLAEERSAALRAFQAALTADDDEQIVAAYVPFLDGHPKLGQREWDRLDLARKRLAALEPFRRALEADIDEEIVAAYTPVLDDCPALGAEAKERLELARRRLEALGKFRTALTNDDDAAIAAAFDPVLYGCKQLKPEDWERLEQAHRHLETEASSEAARGKGAAPDALAYDQVLDSLSRAVGSEQRRLELAQSRLALRARIREAVQRGDIEEAIREESEAGAAIYDEELAAAKKAYVVAHPPTRASASLEGDVLCVRWEWPAAAAIRVAAVAWRRDRFPDSPDEEETESELIDRAIYFRQGGFRRPLGGRSWRSGSRRTSDLVETRGPIYVRVFTALRCLGGEALKQGWVYSSSEAADAKCIARPKCHVQWEIERDSRSGARRLRVATRDGGPLPKLLVVRRAGGMPLNSADGVVVVSIEAGGESSQSSFVVELDVSGWPAGSVLRIFPARSEDAAWVVVEGKYGPGNRIAVS